MRVGNVTPTSTPRFSNGSHTAVGVRAELAVTIAQTWMISSSGKARVLRLWSVSCEDQTSHAPRAGWVSTSNGGSSLLMVRRLERGSQHRDIVIAAGNSVVARRRLSAPGGCIPPAGGRSVLPISGIPPLRAERVPPHMRIWHDGRPLGRWRGEVITDRSPRVEKQLPTVRFGEHVTEHVSGDACRALQ